MTPPEPTATAPSRGGALRREELGLDVVATLSRGGWGNPDVLLVRARGSEVVVKDFTPRPAWVRATFARWLIRREATFYRRLADHPCVPRLLELDDELALALEYRPGEPLSRSLRGVVPAGFMDELREAVDRMHAAGIVHLDLRHRSNILADPYGHPVLLDFASALYLPPGGALARWLLPALARIDRSALEKWRVRLAPVPRDPKADG